MQAYHCVFAIGTFVSPWIAAPFILPDKEVTFNGTTNATSSPVHMAISDLSMWTVLDTLSKAEEESRVQYAFFIIGYSFGLIGGILGNLCHLGQKWSNSRQMWPRWIWSLQVNL